MRGRTGRPPCRHEPAETAMPGHPWLVALGCPRCGWTTGYGTDASVLRERWEAGDVVGPLSEADLLGDGAGVAP